MKKTAVIILCCFSAIMTYLFIITLNSKPSKIPKLNVDSLQRVNDSLHAELFPCEVEINRYRIALEIFHERNPKAAKEYENIITQETE